MARRGVWELTEVVLRYSGSGGSSRGVREFVEKGLATFAERNQQISFSTKLEGGHPCVYGKYVTGYERCIDLKNKDPKEIGKVFSYLRNTLGRRVPPHNEISIGVVEKQKQSVQGFWRNRASLIDKDLPEEAELRARRRSEYGLQAVVDEMGVAGVIRITQKLLEKQELAKQRALAAEPNVERVVATE